MRSCEQVDKDIKEELASECWFCRLEGALDYYVMTTESVEVGSFDAESACIFHEAWLTVRVGPSPGPDPIRWLLW